LYCGLGHSLRWIRSNLVMMKYGDTLCRKLG
jgi:hypothetical protein